MVRMNSVRDLLNGGFSFSDEGKIAELKFIYIHITLLMAFISSPVIGLLHLNQWGGYTSTIHGINCLIFSLFALSLFFYLRRSIDNYELTIKLFLVGLFLIFTSNLVFSVNENIRLLWFVIILIMAQGLAGPRTRNLSIAAVTALFVSYFTLPFFEYTYTITDITSSIILLILVQVLFYFYDHAIKSAISQLEITERQALNLAAVKSEFLSNMSHEIRTPLNGMLGFTEILLKNESEPEKIEQLSHIRSSGNILKGIIGNILDLSKIDHGSMTIENRCFDFRKEMEVMSLFAVSAANKRINYLFKIDPDVPVYFTGDSLRLTQILNNIVGNAIKFTSEKGAVSLYIGVSKDGKTLHFEVQDNGIGISETAQKNIFSPFTQSDNSIGRQYGGTGLGLSISKKLLEMMGTTLELESSLGEGSRFYFDLSIEICCSEVELSKTSMQPIAAGQSQKILVVDDDKLNQTMMEALLKRLGHIVTVVDDGHKVMEMFDKGCFDLVFMDIRMPVMGGVEATRLLRNRGVMIPIIALTANAFKDDIENYLNLGMDECLSKPIDIKQLEYLINRYAVSS